MKLDWLKQNLHLDKFPGLSAVALHRSTFLVADLSVIVAALWHSNAIRSSLLLGMFFVIIGLLLRGASTIAKFENGIPSIIGIYRMLRAPYLSGSAFVWCGIAIATRNFGLLVFSILLVAIWGGIVVLAEKRELRAEKSVRMSYVRDVPLLIPQLVPFSYESSLLETPKSNRWRSQTGVYREWAAFLTIGIALVGFWCSLKYLSLHREIATATTILLILIALYRIYRDYVSRSRHDFQLMLRY